MKLLGFDIKRTSRPLRRAYEAADKSRRGKAFRNAKSTGANNEVAGALVTLRDRSRHMTRNNGWARRAVEAVTKHTIGEGIQPAPEADLATIKSIKSIWTEWAGTTACDWYEKTTFYGLQELAMRSIVEGGDVLILRRWVMPDKHNPLPFKMQILEGDHLDHTRNGYNEKGYCRLGVQFSSDGRLIGYWIFEYHPGDSYIFASQIESKYYPKEDVLHAYEIVRPGQVRGLPFGVAGFMKMSDFSDYEDAQLMKQKVAACLCAFVLGSDDYGSDDDHSMKGIDRLQPGVIQHLSGAESVEFANPPSVADYDAYAARILQGISASYGITYEMLTMDYSKVNFTSGRMAKIDVTTNFKSWQYNMIVPQVCDPVWGWFISACMIKGLISKPICAGWTAPRIQQLDPVKETDAQVKRIKAGLSTPSETIRETGREPEEFWREYKQDIDRLSELGITIDSVNPPNDPMGGDMNSLLPATDKNTSKTMSENPELGSNTAIPAIQYGVDGTQSMVDVITNDALTVEQKANILIEWFDLGSEKAKTMLGI